MVHSLKTYLYNVLSIVFPEGNANATETFNKSPKNFLIVSQTK